MTPQEVLNRYDELLSQCDRFQRKGKTVPYTSANGYMFTLYNKAGEVGIRFSKELQERYFKEFNTSFLLSHGSKMKGYILIPEVLLKDTDRMLQLMNESYDYVMSLPTK